MREWIEEACSDCGRHNLYDNGDPEDLTECDVAAFQCFACGGVTHLYEGDPDEAIGFVKGWPVPTDTGDDDPPPATDADVPASEDTLVPEPLDDRIPD